MPFIDSIDLTFALGLDNPTFTSDQNDIKGKMQTCLVNSIGALAAVAWLKIVGKIVSGNVSAQALHSKFNGSPLWKQHLQDAWALEQSQRCEKILPLNSWAVQTQLVAKQGT